MSRQLSDTIPNCTQHSEEHPGVLATIVRYLTALRNYIQRPHAKLSSNQAKPAVGELMLDQNGFWCTKHPSTGQIIFADSQKELLTRLTETPVHKSRRNPWF